MRSRRVDLGPAVAHLTGPRKLLQHLEEPGHGWSPPDRTRRQPALSVSFRAARRPLDGPTDLHVDVSHEVVARSALWTLRFAPMTGAATVWCAPPPFQPPYGPADGPRSALRSLLAYHLLVAGGGALHAAAVERDGLCVVALGVSGAGKTTFARRDGWRRVLADDYVAIVPGRRRGRPPLVWGTPFRGREATLGQVAAARPTVFALLEKSDRTRATPVSAPAAALAIGARLRVPGRHRRLREWALSAALRLAATVPCVRLESTLEEDPWPCLRSAVSQIR